MSSINGVGTAYIGCSATGKDGSYITTKWLNIVIPVVPLSSHRVLPISQQTSYFPTFHSSQEFYTKPVPLYWPHILQVYGTYLTFILFLSLVDLLTTQNSGKITLHPLLSSFVASVFSFFVMSISRPIRKIGTLTNITVALATLTLSLLLASGFSKAPEQSWNTMYLFWGGYAIYSFISSPDDKKEENSKTKKRR